MNKIGKPTGKRHARFGLRSALLASTALFLAAQPAAGQVVWEGHLSEDWIESGNWSGSAVPTGGDDVVIDELFDGTDSVFLDGEEGEAKSLTVGQDDMAALLIANGGQLTTQEEVRLGNASDSFGALTVAGEDSELFSHSYIMLGPQGDGLLLVEDGGTIRAQTMTIGNGSESESSVSVLDDGTITLDTDMLVGGQGHGELHIGENGHVTNTHARIGWLGSGLVVVEDGGVWENSSYLTVGQSGHGELRIRNGGYVSTSGTTTIGETGSGLVQIDGENGAHWQIGRDLTIGSSGQGTVEISNGGWVDVSDYLVIADDSTAVGMVLVDGDGSLLSVIQTIDVGASGEGSVTVSNGGEVSVGAGEYIQIGANAGSKGTINIGAATGEIAQGAGVLTGDLVIFHNGEGTLVFNHKATEADGYEFTADLESTGGGTHAIEHLAGVTNYTGDGSLFGGTTTIAGGILYVQDALGGSIAVGGSGTLGGMGTLGDVTVGAGGIIAPGNSIGTLNVGSILFHPDSIYDVEIIGGGNTAGIHNDLIAVAGTATLDGGTVNVIALDPETSYQDGQDYTILTADGGVLGSGFDEAATASAFITSTLIHNSGDVVLTIALNTDPVDPDPVDPTPGLFPTAAQTHNQSQVATGLDDLDQTPGSDALAVYNQILMLSEGEARQAFDLTSGEVHASGQRVFDQTFNLFNRTLRQQGAAGIAGHGAAGVVNAPLAYASTSPAPGIGAIDNATAAYSDSRVANAWLAPLGGRGRVDGDGNAATLDWWTAGVAGGYEAPIDAASGNAWAGFGLGYLRSHGAVNDRLSTHDADNFQLGVYGGWADGPWTLTGALAYGASRIETERRIVLGGIDRTAQADYWAHSPGFSGEAAYGFRMGEGTTISPLATVDAGWSGHNGFTETGADALNLSGGPESWTRFEVGLGLGISHVVLTDAGTVTFEGRAVWEHAFGDVLPSQSLSFAGGPTGFDVHGPEAGRDRLRIGAGILWDISDDVNLRANYDGAFSSDQSNHAGSIGLNVRF